MRYPELHYRWAWTLKASPEQIWPYISDTNRFNRDVGLPEVQSIGNGPNARRRLRFSQFGLKVDWEEEPFEWVRPQRFSIRRSYRSGPMKSLRVSASLTANSQGGSELVYETWLKPRGFIGLLAIAFAMSVRNRARFGAVFRHYDREALASSRSSEPPSPRAGFAPGGEARLRDLQRSLIDQGAAPELVHELGLFMRRGDESALARIQPYALADEWQMPRRSVLELFLWATRAGLVDMEWDVLCPLCRGTKESAAKLADVSSNVHCDTCNIDLKTNLERSIELRFRVNPAISRSNEEMFCVAGPQITPHVVMQQLLPPGEIRGLQIALEPGRYRLRCLGLPGGQYLYASADGVQGGRFRVSDDGWPASEERVSTSLAMVLENGTAAERLFILERLEWADKAATAAEVIGLQTFRDLFSAELLRPEQDIQIGSLTVAFTDLRDSTRIYRQIGDATAFGRVLDHFEVLRAEVAAEGGTLIKTIGDAVMAVFPRPLNGIKALLRAQQQLAVSDGSGPEFLLKAGVHEGACIAVTLNDRLDYFGSTVNLASRLEHFSSGDDIIVSDAVRCDPEVDEFVKEAADLTIEPFEAQIKGFDAEDFRLWRIARNGD